MVQGAIEALEPGGAFFLGDVRSAQLLRHFHASVQTFRAADDASAAGVGESARQALLLEKEMVVDPELFLTLPSIIPELEHVSLEMKRSATCSEFSMCESPPTTPNRALSPPSNRAFSQSPIDPSILSSFSPPSPPPHHHPRFDMTELALARSLARSL